MKRATLLALAAGIILFVALLHHYGFAQLAAAVGVAGRGGGLTQRACRLTKLVFGSY